MGKIQPIAIQISKLRFFISLILDQKVDRSKPNFGILTLPNLETKFISANALIGLNIPVRPEGKSQKQVGSINTNELEEYLKKLSIGILELEQKKRKYNYKKKTKR